MVLVRRTCSYYENLCLALFSVPSAELRGCVRFVKNYLTHTHTHIQHIKGRSHVSCYTEYIHDVTFNKIYLTTNVNSVFLRKL